MSKATAEERRHFARVAELGCCVCGRPAEIHHLTGAGMGLKASNYEVIPLCPEHHRNGKIGIALHAGVGTWEKIHGTQEEHLQATMEKLNLE